MSHVLVASSKNSVSVVFLSCFLRVPVYLSSTHFQKQLRVHSEAKKELISAAKRSVIDPAEPTVDVTGPETDENGDTKMMMPGDLDVTPFFHCGKMKRGRK